MTHINQRGDTSANWTSANPVLQLREVGWETNTLKAKLGDGVTPWNGLAYAVAPTDLAPVEDQIDDLEDQVSSLSNTIPAWMPGSYGEGRIVEHNDRWWRAKTDTTDEPRSPEDDLPYFVTAVTANMESTTPSITLPPSVREGDLLILHFGGDGSSAAPPTAVNDDRGGVWTQHPYTTSPGNYPMQTLWVSTAGAASAGAQVQATLATSRKYTMTVYVFRGVESYSFGTDAYSTSDAAPMPWIASAASSSWLLSQAVEINADSTAPVAYTVTGTNSDRVESVYQARGNATGPGKHLVANALFRFDNPVAGTMTLERAPSLYYTRNVCLLLTGVPGEPSDWEELDIFAAPSHTHSTTDIISGTFPHQRLPGAGVGSPGIAAFATNAETQAGTVVDKTVTPATLASRTATETRTGLVEQATLAEVQAGTDTSRFVTPQGLKQEFNRLSSQPAVGEYLLPDGFTLSTEGTADTLFYSGDVMFTPIDVQRPATYSHVAYRVTGAAVGAPPPADFRALRQQH